MVAVHRSVSQLKSYTRCGEQYRLSRTPGARWKPAAWTAVGEALHEAYLFWEVGSRQGKLSDLFKERFDYLIGQYQEKYPDSKDWNAAPRVKSIETDILLRRDNGIVQAEGYEEECRTAEWRLWELGGEVGMLAIEVPFQLPISDTLELKGSIDSVLVWPDGSLTIRDLKTGNKGLPDNRQLGLYGWALRELYGVTAVYGQYWYGKLNDSGGWVDLRRYTAEYLRDQYTKLDAAIRQEIFLANPGKACDFCEYKSGCREMGDLLGRGSEYKANQGSV